MHVAGLYINVPRVTRPSMMCCQFGKRRQMTMIFASTLGKSCWIGPKNCELVRCLPVELFIYTIIYRYPIRYFVRNLRQKQDFQLQKAVIFASQYFTKYSISTIDT